MMSRQPVQELQSGVNTHIFFLRVFSLNKRPRGEHGVFAIVKEEIINARKIITLFPVPLSHLGGMPCVFSLLLTLFIMPAL